MDFAFVVPLGSYCVASVATIHGLRQPKQIRHILLIPILAFSLISLCTAKSLPWRCCLSSSFASVVVFHIPYSLKLLLSGKPDVQPGDARSPLSFVDCYRIWNNPRGLQQNGESKSTVPAQSRTGFFIHQLRHATFLWMVDTVVFQTLLALMLVGVKGHDFSPAMEIPSPVDVGMRQLRIRVIMAVQWCWSAYFSLEFYHSLLACAFVSILRFDLPGTWPPLFGSIKSVDGIRAFWGRFWHTLTTPTYKHYSLLVTRRLLHVPPGSHVENVLLPFFIFTFSGLSHSAVGWSMGDGALARDILFFELNFVAAAVETYFSRPKKQISRFADQDQIALNAIGALRVYAFFFCVAPLWVYPKVYPTVRFLE